MSAPATITADGMIWPLDTYLDCGRFIRTDGEVPYFASFPGSLDIITFAGELREMVDMSDILWSAVLAVRVPLHSVLLAHCDNCGEGVVPIERVTDKEGRRWISTDWCIDCMGEME